MSHPTIPTKYYAFVIVRQHNKFLLIKERRFQQHWYFPGGAVEFGENIEIAAQRETLEEAGVSIVLDGIFSIQHINDTRRRQARLRVFFVAHPHDNTPPKGIADEHSLGAAWYTLEQIKNLPLREPNVITFCESLCQNSPIYPVKLLRWETPR